MKANVKGAIEQARAPHVSFVRCKLRAEVDKRVQEVLAEYEDQRRRELEEYARVLDETLLYTLHKELGFGPKRLSRLWDAMLQTRIDARIFFRDGSSAYEEQETGKNIEDLGIRAELRKIGIDLGVWVMDGVEIPAEAKKTK